MREASTLMRLSVAIRGERGSYNRERFGHSAKAECSYPG